MDSPAQPFAIDAATVVNDWLVRFAAALTASDAETAARLFADDGHWRDIVAFTWTIEQHSGRAAVRDALAATVGQTRPHAFRIAPGRTPPRYVTRVGTDTIEALFAFETAYGTASGVVRLVPDMAGSGGWLAWLVVTTLDDLSNVPGQSASLRDGHGRRNFGGDTWLARRQATQAFADREPACVVIGAGQAGLGIAARLGALGVDTLVVDRHTRIGDNWRKRYDALTLHNEVFVNHMPYLPFPETWPLYIPKDKLANWFEIYAEALDLNVWTGTSLTSGTYDDVAARWRLTLTRADGTTREVRPRHFVFATGVSAIPIRPNLPGLGDFKGTVMHSDDFTRGEAWAGNKALIVGTGTSAHDIAQDLEAYGADVTLIQRSSTYVVSLKQAQKVYALYQEGPPVADCDLIATATCYPLTVRSYQLSTADMKKADQPLLDRLQARGFRLSDGDPDGTGFQMQYMRHGGGYYFNVGCSERIADGKIGVMRWDDVERFCADGAMMKDGSVTRADLVVVATGYKNQRETVRAYLGDAIADRIGPVWGFDDGGELANMWKRTPQPGLWFTAGSLAQSRIYSKYLALQIKAVELGLIDAAAPPVPANGIAVVEADLLRRKSASA